MAPYGVPPKPPVGPLACVDFAPTQYNVSWPHGELHRRPQCYRSHAFPPPSAAFHGPIVSFTEKP
eukprot:9480760-Pyramimonas_sp.AAC.1